jgi:hypothetical protein
VDAVKVDQFTARFEEVGSLPEGCVADDFYGHLYISGTSGLWKYNAEPGTVRPIRKVDSRESGRLGGDLEGVAIYHLDATTGYILVSDQNRSAFAVYQREGNNDFITTFKIRANDNLDIDEVSGTDGIDVTNVALGAAFPHGVFVAHDTNNTATSNPNSTRYKSNYKLVRWDDIAKGVEPTLNMSTIWNPRHGGSSDTPSPTTPAPTPAPTPSPTPTPTDRAGCPPATAEGTALTAAADARVEEESPTTNYGSDTVLRVDGEDYPDEFNHIVEGGHYGFPYFYGDPPENGGTRGALATFPPHSAPTGLTFYSGDQYPPEYAQVAFTTLWARGEIAQVEVARTAAGEYLSRASTFGSGFLYPIDVVTGPDGNLYVADFGTSAIYRITYDSDQAW